jgi:hypothetical protein
MIDRERANREASLTAGVVDNQLVKAPAAQAGWIGSVAGVPTGADLGPTLN